MSTKWTFVHVASCSGSHMSYVSPSLIPHNIILTDIRAILDLDDLERDAAGVFELVLRCLRDEYGLALVEHGPLLTARDLGGAAQDDPMLRNCIVMACRGGRGLRYPTWTSSKKSANDRTCIFASSSYPNC